MGAQIMLLVLAFTRSLITAPSHPNKLGLFFFSRHTNVVDVHLERFDDRDADNEPYVLIYM